MVRRLFVLGLLILASPFSLTVQAADFPALSEATAIVTGTREDTRSDGMARALRDVLVKRSGNPGLPRDPRVDAMEANAADMVEDYLYLDRLSDMPHHDEQGTRDRPYTLIVRFSPAKLDAALAALGDGPWLAARPKLLVRIMITDKRGSYPLTADGDNDERHRQALLAAATRYGMHVVLTPLGKANETATTPDALLVTGTLRWSDADAGWVGVWSVGGDQASGPKSWGIAGVSFDDAFRDLVRGAMAIASGHELPRPRP